MYILIYVNFTLGYRSSYLSTLKKIYFVFLKVWLFIYLRTIVILLSEIASPSLAVNEDVEVVVCYFGFHEDCEEMFFIRKKLCPGDYYVYRLVPTRPDSAYCFGKCFFFSLAK